MGSRGAPQPILNLGATYLLTYLLHGAESSLKANRFSASQEIPTILWNSNARYII